ncbi:MAG: ribosome-binding factor A [Myxococcota bacterium]|jgi:ribosome-binding factor A
MASARRQQQICARIQRKVAELLTHEIKDPRASFVTVTSVSISTDLAIATIKWTVLVAKDRSKVEHMFEHANKFIRRAVARDINIRSAPMVKFEFDRGLEHAQKINQILADLKLNSDSDETDAT